nr:PREDICTED: uncharacterized protein LOC109031666 [Bemisia tabaci]
MENPCSKRGRPARRGHVSRNPSLRLIERRGEMRLVLDLPYSFRRSIYDVNERDFPEINLGLLTVKCQYCDALHFKREQVNGHFNTCCHNDLLRLAEPEISDQLRDLFSKPVFMTNILRYNSCMAFASFSASKAHIPGVGPYCFKIQDQNRSCSEKL